MIFFTSDQHFNHNRIIQYCKRPFQTIEEMNQTLIERWNSRISKSDEVYIIGDFAFSEHKKFLDVLNGKKHLIAGSHDLLSKEVIKSCFETISKYKKIRFERRTLILSHCPLRCWEDAQLGSIHLFGHEHGRIHTYNLSMDVSVDTNNYFPYSMPEILVKMDSRKEEMKKSGRIFFKNKIEQFYQDDVRWFEHIINSFTENVKIIKGNAK